MPPSRDAALLLTSLAICGASAEDVEDCTRWPPSEPVIAASCEFTKHEGMEAEACAAAPRTSDGAAKFHYARLEVCEYSWGATPRWVALRGETRRAGVQRRAEVAFVKG